MDNVNLLVAENLKHIRLQKGWSQAFVANQLGIAQRTISRAECGEKVANRTLKLLCNMYQIPVGDLYIEETKTSPRGSQIVPDDVAVALLSRTSFIRELEQEVILRFCNTVKKDGLMMREDIELVLTEVLSSKKSYSLQEVISACMFVNQQTVNRVKFLAS